MGATSGMKMMLEGMKGMGVMDVVAQGHMLNTPGVTTEFMISGMSGYRLSLVSMLIPTNDTFVGANMMLPMEGGMMGYVLERPRRRPHRPSKLPFAFREYSA